MTERTTDHSDNKPVSKTPKMQFLYPIYNKSKIKTSPIILSDLHFIIWMFTGIIVVSIITSALISICSLILSSSYNILIGIFVLFVIAIVLVSHYATQ